MRRLARETVFRFIFAKFFNPEDEELFAVLLKSAGLSEDDASFAYDLLKAVENNKDNLLIKIDDYAKKFSFNRVHFADKCALLIGMSEIENFPQTPTAVVIDQAVSLAAAYSTEKSTDFVNAVMAQYVKEKNNG